MADADETDDPAAAAKDPQQVAAYWIGQLDLADKSQKAWRALCKRIMKRYREERSENSRARRFAIFWSNIQTLGPAVYARTPQGVVSRRYKDADPVGRVATEILERALNFSVDAYDFSNVMMECRDEFLLFARGQAWVRYIPHISQAPGAPVSPSTDPDEVAPDPELDEVVDWEEVRADYVPWEDFGHNQARNWAEVSFVYRRACMTRADLISRFGEEIGRKVPLDWKCDGGSDNPSDEASRKAQVYEIWDLVSRNVYWISKSYSWAPLDCKPDPLKLRDFFPCPRPLFGTLTPDSLIPIPDYVYYRDQAEELDELTARIDKLTDALKFTGFYAAHHKDEIQQLLAPQNENKLVPVESWSNLKDDGGVKGMIEYWPAEVVAEVIKECVALRKELIADIYQITGIADIMRGQGDPNETATAQGIKAQWGSLRVRDRQRELERFSRDLLRIMGEIIAGQFSTDTLSKMTDVKLFTAAEKQQIQQQMQSQAQLAQQGGHPPPPVPPQIQDQLNAPSWDDVTALLQDRATRMFRIDIETDSTIQPNEQEEKQGRVEFTTAIVKLFAEGMPIIQSTPAAAPAFGELTMYLARGFRAGREMEETLEQLFDKLQQQPPQPPPGKAPPLQANPQVEQAKAQADQTNAQANLIKAQASQQGVQVEAQKVASTHAIGMAQVQAEQQRTVVDAHATQIDAHQHVVENVQKAMDREQQRVLSTAMTPGPLIPPEGQRR
jgi:hypothetical protein